MVGINQLVLSWLALQCQFIFTVNMVASAFCVGLTNSLPYKTGALSISILQSVMVCHFFLYSVAVW